MRYITIKEFSDKANKSPQAIYKRFFYNKKYKNYILKENGVNKISTEALKLYNIDLVDDDETIQDKGQAPNDNDIIEILKKQLEEKDKQINNLTQTIQGLTITNMTLNNKLLMIETKDNTSLFKRIFKRNKQETPQSNTDTEQNEGQD